MIDRRRLLGAGLATVAAGLGLRALWVSPADGIVDLLRRRLDYLQLDADGLRRFAADYVASGKTASTKLRIVALISPLYHAAAALGQLPVSLRRGEERIATAYLLSSDFFSGGAREDQPVHYLGLFDPWAQHKACFNPFGRRSDQT